MAHNLASLNNAIMYAQLQTLGLPWWANSRHPDGTVMSVNTWQPGASIEDMRAAAGMAWDWLKLPAMVQVPGFANAVRAEGFSITCRSSDLAPLGQVSDDYHLHTLDEVFSTFQALAAETAGGGWTISTMGALRQGRQIFAVAERGETVAVSPYDTSTLKLMMQTSCDGSLPTMGVLSVIRTVCDNTRKLALSKSTGRAKQRHRSTMNGGALLSALSLDDAAAAWAADCERMRILADTPCTDGQARDILRSIYGYKAPKDNTPDPAPTHAAQTTDGPSFADLMAAPARFADVPALTNIRTGQRQVQDVIEREKGEHIAIAPILRLFMGAGQGADLEGSKGTLHGLLNAVTEYTDHHTARSWDSRKSSAFFGQGADKKAEAETVILDRAGIAYA